VFESAAFRLIRTQWIIRTRGATLKVLGAAKLRLASTWRLNSCLVSTQEAVSQDAVAEQPEVGDETRKTSRQSAPPPRTKELPTKGFVSQCEKRACPANTYTPILYRKYVGKRLPASSTLTDCRGEVRFKDKTILQSAVVCNSMPHDINDDQRHDEPLPLRWTEVEFMRCRELRRSIPFPYTTLTMLSLFSKAAPRLLRPLATTASKPSFPLIQKTTMSTCKSRRKTHWTITQLTLLSPTAPASA
jgi:hypothetical protein